MAASSLSDHSTAVFGLSSSTDPYAERAAPGAAISMSDTEYFNLQTDSSEAADGVILYRPRKFLPKKGRPNSLSHLGASAASGSKTPGGVVKVIRSGPSRPQTRRCA